MPNQLDVISVLFFCKKSLLARHAFALFERTTSISEISIEHDWESASLASLANWINLILETQ